MTETRAHDLNRFHRLLANLERKIGGPRRLSDCDGRMSWPSRGVYFFREPGEDRTDTGTGRRIVRVGTHALKSRAGTSLWTRHRNIGGARGRVGRPSRRRSAPGGCPSSHLYDRQRFLRPSGPAPVEMTKGGVPGSATEAPPLNSLLFGSELRVHPAVRARPPAVSPFAAGFPGKALAGLSEPRCPIDGRAAAPSPGDAKK